MTHEDDDDSATRQRAMASGRAVATTGVQVNAYAVRLSVGVRARKWTATNEGGTGGGRCEGAKSGKESVGESRERREVAGDSPRNSAALFTATHCDSTRMHTHLVIRALRVPKKRLKRE